MTVWPTSAGPIWSDSRRSALGEPALREVRHLASEFYRLALSRSKDFR